MTSLQLRSSTPITKPRRLSKRGVKSLPIAGYTHRWAPGTLTLDDGAFAFQLPNVKTDTLPMTTTSTSTPPILTTDLAGRRYVYNDAARLYATPDDTFSYTQATLVVVMKVDSIPASAALIVGSVAPNFTIGVAGGKFYGGAGKPIYGPAYDTTTHVLIFSSAAGGGSVFSIDGVEYTGDAGTNALTEAKLFGGDTTNVLRGRIYDAAVYPFAMTAKQRALTTAHLLSEYPTSN